MILNFSNFNVLEWDHMTSRAAVKPAPKHKTCKLHKCVVEKKIAAKKKTQFNQRLILSEMGVLLSNICQKLISRKIWVVAKKFPNFYTVAYILVFLQSCNINILPNFEKSANVFKSVWWIILRVKIGQLFKQCVVVCKINGIFLNLILADAIFLSY